MSNKNYIHHLIEWIDRLGDAPISKINIERIRVARMELDRLYFKDERYWAQRSTIMWLREGDRNTQFFHVRASHRKKKLD